MSHEYAPGQYPGDLADVADKVRGLLLTLPPEKRSAALSDLDICRHCGCDERGPDGKVPPRSCQCWNDE